MTLQRRLSGSETALHNRAPVFQGAVHAPAQPAAGSVRVRSVAPGLLCLRQQPPPAGPQGPGQDSVLAWCAAWQRGPQGDARSAGQWGFFQIGIVNRRYREPARATWTAGAGGAGI